MRGRDSWREYQNDFERFFDTSRNTKRTLKAQLSVCATTVSSVGDKSGFRIDQALIVIENSHT